GKTSRGNSGTPMAIQTGDHLLDIIGMAGDGSGAFQPAGLISIVSDENTTSSASGGNVRISTTPIGTIIPQERIRITANGNVGIGTTSPLVALEVNGAIKVNNEVALCGAGKAGAIRFNAGQMELCDGTPPWKIM